MRSLHRFVGCALALLAGTSRADIQVSIPAAANISTTYGVGVDASSLNAAKIKSLSGATYYAGKASSASLTETSAGELSLKYSLVYAVADGAYGTATGILLPLTPDWGIKDLTSATAITYEIKAATAGLTAHLLIGSDAYPAAMAAENAALVSNPTAALTTSYTAVTVLASELLAPTWAKSAAATTTGWIADGTAYTTGIAPFVKNLNIQPILDGSWNSDGSGFLTTAAAKVKTSNTITIKNVVVKGLQCYCPVLVPSCTGTSILVDDFSATDPVTGSTRAATSPNYVGGYWFAYSDTGSSPAKRNNLATGMSSIVLPTGATSWAPQAGVAAIATAQLEKDVTGATVLFHKSAGWASIGTELPGSNPDRSLALASLTAIGFDLYAGASLATYVPGATFDSDLVKRIIFRVGRSGISDDSAFEVSLPVPQGAAPTMCVDVSLLKQPSWDSLPVAWSSNDLTKLSWTIKIENETDSTIHATSVPSTFAVTNVRLYGVDPAGIRSLRGHGSEAFLANYRSGLVLSYAVTGPSALVEVRNLSGTRVASFQQSPQATNLTLPVSLSRGTYVVSVQGNGARQTALLNVAR